MSLVQAKCPNCGGDLTIDGKEKAAVCPYCGKAYIVEEAINGYNAAQNFEIEGDTLLHYTGFSPTVVIPDGVSKIGVAAFGACESLEGIIIPERITTIGAMAFNGCTSLYKINIPKGVTTIDFGTFSYCKNLKSITLPASVTTIGIGAFSMCESLQGITIPEGVTTIGIWAFSICESLESITIPISVKAIGRQAFADCTNLKKITILGNPTIDDTAIPASCDVVFEALRSWKENNPFDQPPEKIKPDPPAGEIDWEHDFDF